MPSKQKYRGRYFALGLATGLLVVNFWAWSLLSPIATVYVRELSLSPLMISVLLASTVIIGALGRVPLGLLSDRFGGKRMFVTVCFAACLPVIGLALAQNYNQLLLSAVCLGVAGASFAVGIPFVNAWFPANQRGLALGIYGMGNVGSAISGALTPTLVGQFGKTAGFILVASILVLSAFVMLLLGRESPAWRPNRTPALARLSAAIRWKPTWNLALLYAITFGAFVSFGMYLPIILTVVYGLDVGDAAARAAGFILLATVARPVGGWLSDRIGGRNVLRGVFAVVAVLVIIISFNPTLNTYGAAAYLGLAVMLGLGNGAVFAILGHWCDPKLVGSVTGIVGAVGGLGGLFPPLILGLSYQIFHSYSIPLLLLSAVCALVLLGSRALFTAPPLPK